MMTRTLILSAALIVVAGCNRGPEVNEKNASIEEVAAKVRAASGENGFIKPGEWVSKTTLEEFDMPGMPPEAADRMRAAIAKSQQAGFTSCLSEADVKKPEGKFFGGSEQCRYDHFTMGNGKIDAAMTCPSGDGASQAMTMQGSYTPTSYDMHMTMMGKGTDGPSSSMKMKMHVVSNRTGECTADTAEAPTTNRAG